MKPVEIVARAIQQSQGEGAYWKEYLVDATAAIRALEEAGYAVVPVEPTPEMLAAAGKYANFCAVHNYGGCPDEDGVWRAMLDAARRDEGAERDEVGVRVVPVDAPPGRR